MVLLLSSRVSYFSSSASCPRSSIGESVSVTVRLLSSRVSNLFSSFSSASLASTVPLSALELDEVVFSGAASPNRMDEIRELTEAFLELTETRELAEALADALGGKISSSSSETASRLVSTLELTDVSLAGVEDPKMREDILELMDALAAGASGAVSESSLSWV